MLRRAFSRPLVKVEINPLTCIGNLAVLAFVVRSGAGFAFTLDLPTPITRWGVVVERLSRNGTDEGRRLPLVPLFTPACLLEPGSLPGSSSSE